MDYEDHMIVLGLWAIVFGSRGASSLSYAYTKRPPVEGVLQQGMGVVIIFLPGRLIFSSTALEFWLFFGFAFFYEFYVCCVLDCATSWQEPE